MKKNNKKFEILLIALLVVLIAGLGLTLYLRRNTITNVNKVLANKYDEIKCVDDAHSACPSAGSRSGLG